MIAPEKLLEAAKALEPQLQEWRQHSLELWHHRQFSLLLEYLSQAQLLMEWMHFFLSFRCLQESLLQQLR